MLFRAVPLAVAAIVAGFVQHRVGDVVLAGAVALDYGLNQVLRDIGIIGKELLGVFREAVAAVAEGRVVVVRADSWVKADTFDDGLRVKAFYLRIGVKFIEVADTQGEVGVGEELHGLGLFHAHKERVNVLLDCALLKKSGEYPCIFLSLRIADGVDGGVLLVPFLVLGGGEDFRIADYDSGRVEVVVEGLALAEEFRGEQEVELLALECRIREELEGVLDVKAAGVTNRDGGFDDHNRIRIDS